MSAVSASCCWLRGDLLSTAGTWACWAGARLGAGCAACPARDAGKYSQYSGRQYSRGDTSSRCGRQYSRRYACVCASWCPPVRARGGRHCDHGVRMRKLRPLECRSKLRNRWDIATQWPSHTACWSCTCGWSYCLVGPQVVLVTRVRCCRLPRAAGAVTGTRCWQPTDGLPRCVESRMTKRHPEIPEKHGCHDSTSRRRRHAGDTAAAASAGASSVDNSATVPSALPTRPLQPAVTAPRVAVQQPSQVGSSSTTTPTSS